MFILFYFIYLFLQREAGREGGIEGEKYPCVVASHMLPTGDQAHNPGTSPNREQNC